MKIKDYSVSNEEFYLKYIDYYDMYQTLPIVEHIEKYYNSNQYISHNDSKKGVVNFLYQQVKKLNINRKIKLVEQYHSDGRKILDIGAGTGDFLLSAQKKHWEIFGIEPSSSARKKAELKGIHLCSKKQFLNEKYFDCITLWHCLEHIADLKTEIQFIKKHLSTNGTLIIAVPNFKSWDAKHYGKYWAAYDVPRHYWHFSKNSIERIFYEYGFKIVKIKPMWFDAFYISILSEMYKNNKYHILKGVIKGLYSNLYGIINGEFSSHIYILKKIKTI